jgi:hypothetical protein
MQAFLFCIWAPGVGTRHKKVWQVRLKVNELISRIRIAPSNYSRTILKDQ